MSTKNSSVRFTLDFADKTIVGTKASFTKAGKGFGPVYDELVALMAKHPDFECDVKEPKQPAKPKQSYKGMDIDFIKDFFAAIGLITELNNLNKVLAFAEKDKKSKYPLAKRMLFDAVPEFNYVSAKEEVAEYRHKRTLEHAGVLKVKESILTKETKPDLAATDNIVEDLAPAANF